MADPIDSRKFSDDEVREILERAVQRSASKALTSSDGMSLADLKSIAAEVGIDPVRIEEAARSVVVAPGSRPAGLWGGPLRLHAERVVEGEPGGADAPDLIAVIRRVTGRQGEVHEVGGALEWSDKGGSVTHYVSVSGRDGKSTIRAGADLSAMAVGTLLPAGVVGAFISAMGFLMGMDQGTPEVAVLALLIVPTVYLAGRTFLNRLSRKEARKLDAVVDELARMVESDPSRG